MAHPLDSAYEKLRRASEHVEQARAETEAFFKTQPYFVYPKYDFDTGEHTIRVRAHTDPPSRLALIAADALQNLRSALDHVIYQLAGLDPDTPRGERTQFPIYDTRERFNKMPAWMLEGVPKHHRAHLNAVQPYNPDFRLLWPLLILNDRDKHRVLGAYLASPVRLTIHTLPEVRETIQRIGADEQIYLDDDAVLGTFRADREVPMVFQADWTVGFGLREGPRLHPDDLSRLVGRVSQIVGHFRMAFD